MLRAHGVWLHLGASDQHSCMASSPRLSGTTASWKVLQASGRIHLPRSYCLPVRPWWRFCMPRTWVPHGQGTAGRHSACVGQPTTCMSLWQPGRYLNTVACHTRQARQDSCLTGQQPAHGMVEWRVGDLFRWCHSPLAGAIGVNSPNSDCLGIQPRWRCCVPPTWPHMGTAGKKTSSGAKLTTCRRAHHMLLEQPGQMPSHTTCHTRQAREDSCLAGQGAGDGVVTLPDCKPAMLVLGHTDLGQWWCAPVWRGLPDKASRCCQLWSMWPSLAHHWFQIDAWYRPCNNPGNNPPLSPLAPSRPMPTTAAPAGLCRAPPGSWDDAHVLRHTYPLPHNYYQSGAVGTPHRQTNTTSGPCCRAAACA